MNLFQHFNSEREAAIEPKSKKAEKSQPREFCYCVNCQKFQPTFRKKYVGSLKGNEKCKVCYFDLDECLMKNWKAA